MQAEAHGRAPYLHMLWGSLAFAGMGAFGHLAGEYCSWQWVALARTAVAFLIAYVVTKASGVKLVFWKPGTLWVRSLAGSAGLLGNFYALTHLPISDALTLSNTSPIFVTLLLWAVFDQKPHASTVMAVLMGIFGIVLIQQPHFQSGWFACLMALEGALGTSIAMIGLNRLQSVDPRAVVTHFSGVSSLTTAGFLLATGVMSEGRQPDGMKALVFLFMTGLTGVLGQFGMTMAFARGHAARVSVVILSQIFFALILDLVVWHRAINVISVIGMILVAAPTGWLILHDATRRAEKLAEAEA
ncbi:MAG TPA: DMT family transporter [Blastocatellia bacterium]|nr:DMT family transporter [Blastocatellia bacterium]